MSSTQLIILVSGDGGDTFHEVSGYMSYDQLSDIAKSYDKKKEKENPPLNPPKRKRKEKGNQPPNPLHSDFELTSDDQPSKPKKANYPAYAEIYGLVKTYYPDWSQRESAEKRNRKVRKIWNANGRSVLVFEELLKMVQASDFLNARNGHTFRGTLNFSWVVNHFEEIMDGKYTNERMAFALNSKSDMIDAMVVGEGRKKIDPTKFKHLGQDEVTGLPKYIRTQ
ncbi:MAG: hypothetical protein CMF45_08680 [Legionellales bacterium]|nr:hypothetical protein [Legionellales bacterium]